MTQQQEISPFLERLLEGVEVTWKPLKEIATINRGSRVTKKELHPSKAFPVYSGGVKPMGYYQKSNQTANTITVVKYGTAGFVNFIEENFWANDVCYCIQPNQTNNKYLYYFLKANESKIQSLAIDAIPAHLQTDKISNLKIPIPCPQDPTQSLRIQQTIVTILDKFRELKAALNKELIARKKQYTHYRKQLLTFDEHQVEWKKLADLAVNLNSNRKPIASALREAGDIPYYGASGIIDYVKDYIFDGDYLLISEDGANLLARKTPIAFSISGKNWVNNHAHVLKFKTYSERKFVEYYLNNIDLTPYITGKTQPKLNKKNLNKIQIPIPSLAEQERIVRILDQFETLTTSISEGLPREIDLRQKQYEYYRQKLLSFPKD